MYAPHRQVEEQVFLSGVQGDSAMDYVPFIKTVVGGKQGLPAGDYAPAIAQKTISRNLSR